MLNYVKILSFFLHLMENLHRINKFHQVLLFHTDDDIFDSYHDANYPKNQVLE